MTPGALRGSGVYGSVGAGLDSILADATRRLARLEQKVSGFQVYTCYSGPRVVDQELKRERLALVDEVQTKIAELRAISAEQDACSGDSSALPMSATAAALVARVDACFVRIREIAGQQVVVGLVDSNIRMLVYWDWQYGYAFAQPETSFLDTELSTDLACHMLASPDDAVGLYGAQVLELGPAFALRSV